MQISNTATSPAAIGAAPPPVQANGGKNVLLHEAGERNVTLSRNDQGRVDLTLSPPPVTQLVLSGGGAKGVAYPGVIKSLEESDALAGVRSISGASAGGLSAALLAGGMSADEFTELSNDLDLTALLNSSNAVVSWLQNRSSQLGKWFGKFSDKVQAGFTVVPRLGAKAEQMEELVRTKVRATVLARIAESGATANLPPVQAIADKLKAGGVVTFMDLQVLSRHMPAIKELNITGTGTFEGRSQLVVFNASLTPDMDIARAAHISAALPVVFKAPVEQGHGFQVAGEENTFQDGGLLLNTPVDGLYQRQFPDSPLDRPEHLILRFETLPVQSRGSYSSSLVDRGLGVHFTAQEQLNEARINKDYSEQTVVIPLKSEQGDYSGFFNGTVNFSLSDAAKKQLQDNARKAVGEHQAQRAQTREHHRFESIESAVLAMDDNMLAGAEATLAQDEGARDVLRFRGQAKEVLAQLHQGITEVNGTQDRLEITPRLASVLRNLDALVTHPAHAEWLAKQLNAPDNANFQQLLQVAAKLPREAVSRVLLGAVDEMKRRDVAVIAGNFISNVIYPTLFQPGQPDANIELLRRAERDLGKATTPEAFNRVVDDLIEHYVARGKVAETLSPSTLVEQARAWRMRVK